MPSPFYVYTLRDHLGAIFYVGKGCGPRIHVHEKEAKRGKPSPVCQRIREIWSQRGSVVKNKVFVTSVCSEAFTRESEMILLLGIENLCNRIPGGFGGTEGNRNAAGPRTKEQKIEYGLVSC